jgi:rRNA maturation protein Nop10
MTRHTVFLQECPICGRPLEVRKEYQGKKVACRHCGGWFLAVDPSRHPQNRWNKSNSLLHRAEQLLETCASYSSAMN